MDLSLHRAAERGDLETLRRLLADGADPDLPAGDEGWTPLFLAGRRGPLAAAEALLDAGADPNAGTLRPIDLALRTRRLPILERLLQRGGVPDRIDMLSAAKDPAVWEILARCSSVAMHRAVFEGDVDAVREALDRGADPDALDSDGQTALARAVQKRNAALIDLLLERGADPGRDPWPLFVAARENDAALLDRLLSAGADTPPPPELLRLLISQGARVDRKRLALRTAAEKGCEEAVGILLDAGADRDEGAFETARPTPRELAERAGFPAVVARLDAAGARLRPASAPPADFEGPILHPINQQRPQTAYSVRRVSDRRGDFATTRNAGFRGP